MSWNQLSYLEPEFFNTIYLSIYYLSYYIPTIYLTIYLFREQEVEKYRYELESDLRSGARILQYYLSIYILSILLYTFYLSYYLSI